MSGVQKLYSQPKMVFFKKSFITFNMFSSAHPQHFNLVYDCSWHSKFPFLQVCLLKRKRTIDCCYDERKGLPNKIFKSLLSSSSWEDLKRDSVTFWMGLQATVSVIVALLLCRGFRKRAAALSKTWSLPFTESHHWSIWSKIHYSGCQQTSGRSCSTWGPYLDMPKAEVKCFCTQRMCSVWRQLWHFHCLIHVIHSHLFISISDTCVCVYTERVGGSIHHFGSLSPLSNWQNQSKN